MAEDHIRYDILTREALRGVVRKVLSEVAKTGLPGNHHFFISFATRAPGVRIAKRLMERYPTEMTIVLQNQFWELIVSDSHFEVGLSFDDIPEKLIVPFSAIIGFFDPSVEFALKFVVEDSAEQEESGEDDAMNESDGALASSKAGGKSASKSSDTDEDDTPPPTGEKVVSLDSFRKKT